LEKCNYHNIEYYPSSCLLFRNITLRKLNFLCLQVESLQMVLIERANLSLCERHAPQISTDLNWDRTRVRLYGIYSGQSGNRAGFLRVIQFPFPSILPTAPDSSSSITIRGWYNGSVVASVIAGSVPLHPSKKKTALAMASLLPKISLHLSSYEQLQLKFENCSKRAVTA
jgi:hypothetical protein